ncbi:hypothetical protein GCM10010172_65090 [Paractinoplanes ferrugineus]|uniref:Amino acid adenylation domain-containing protein n=1 Tax=Paractinoplanes ferrugineus TaxID=113564 RepID=A0A919J219_9ACTN|nr:amino acid adenylation domain-containing protein [Actinoplanes ferrugineus]GIE13331.1 hypothetical protein Afe05nite_51710 [Actinoplanes ferrugineus]
MADLDSRALAPETGGVVVDFGDDRSVPERITAQAAATPNAIALRAGDRDVTYAELERRGNQVAHRLLALGVGADDIVAVLAERGIDMVVSLVGIEKAGAAYLPLDCDHPPQRLTFLLADTDAKAVLTHADAADRLPPTDRPVIRVDTDEELTRQPGTDPGVRPGADDLAYVIYTSGSTGNPKGVMVGHAAIRNRLQWMQSEYPIGPGNTVLQKTPYTFDVSVWEFFWPLMTGARMVLARPGGHRDNPYLISLIEAERVDTLHFVPSMLRYFLNTEGAAGVTAPARVFCSGEALPADLRDRFFAVLPGTELHNLYGPTEAAVDVTYWQCRPADTDRTVPIGRPIANMRCYILGPDDRPVPPGAEGELHLAGIGLARGYLDRPELTAEKFPPDPLGGGRMYRTGDIARWRPDGTIEYLGRTDGQVKLNGQRIETGEIESALLGCPGVTGAAVTLDRSDDTARLVGYVTGPDPADPAAGKTLVGLLADRLPPALVPAVLLVIPEFPMTSSGKLDRKRLPAPADAETGPAGCLVPLTPPAGGPAWFWIHPTDGEVGRYATLTAGRTAYGLEAYGLDEGEPLDTVPAIAARHLAEIRSVQPAGPYRLGGWQAGALIAYEIAVRLRAAGAEVAALVLLAPEAAGAADDSPVEVATARAVAGYRPPAFDGPVTLVRTGPARWTPPALLDDHVVDTGERTLLESPVVARLVAGLH